MLNAAENEEQLFHDKMETAASIFYDFITEYNQELVSPQYDELNKASTAEELETQEQEKREREKYLFKEINNDLTL